MGFFILRYGWSRYENLLSRGTIPRQNFMKFPINRKIRIAFTCTVMCLCSCESLLDIEVGILWQDDPFFSDTGTVYLGILKGKWDSNTGFDNTVLDISEVQPGMNESCRFSVNTSKSDNFTAFIFIDIGDNGIYDDGYDTVLGYKYNYGESGGNLEISLSAYY